MPGTYSQLLLHIVTATKGRTPWISTGIAERLYPYVGGIVRAERGMLHAIGGVEDHAHMYLRWLPASRGARRLQAAFRRVGSLIAQRARAPAQPSRRP